MRKRLSIAWLIRAVAFIGLVAFIGPGALIGSGSAMGGSAAAADTGVCAQRLPRATDGQLRLETASARPGSSVLAVLSGFRRWPTSLIGGGSGETFVSCTPWLPLGRAEVMVHDASAFFLFTVPATASPGRIDVSVVFNDSSSSATEPGHYFRLTTVLTIVNSSVPSPATSVACATTHRAAAAGTLRTGGPLPAGRSAQVTLAGVTADRVHTLNEYDRLMFVACLGNAATVVARSAAATVPFNVAVPSGLTTGDYPLSVVGVLDGTVVSWSRMVRVVGTAPTSTAPSSTAPTSSSPTSSSPSSSISGASSSSSTSAATPSSTATTTSPASTPAPTGLPSASASDRTSNGHRGLLIGLGIAALWVVAGVGFAFWWRSRSP